MRLRIKYEWIVGCALGTALVLAAASPAWSQETQQQPPPDKQEPDKRPSPQSRKKEENPKGQTQRQQQDQQRQQQVDRQKQKQDQQRLQQVDRQRQQDQQVQQRQQQEQQRQQQIDRQNQANQAAQQRQNQQRTLNATRQSNRQGNVQQVFQQRQNSYNQERQQNDHVALERITQLQQQRRQSQLAVQQQYIDRVRQDQANLRNWQNRDNSPMNYRYYRGGRYYQTNQLGVEMLQRGINNGYDAGFRAGQADRMDRTRFNYEDSYAYQDGTWGYSGYYVDVSEYRYYFRQGFNRGYQDGFYNRYRYGRNTNGVFSLLGNVLQAIFNASRY